ncbi:helix-turn-helix transcriptional regulator [Thiomicrorhabdus sp. Milos-T2]|uniref:ArsR/SmtB family transcription factor n=1 Tax=Thiomicrorhabdus sp. Milos-T2 TaxID=90814 RepID=UPI000689F329|nr:metalloregulator ArsR/SmtB family transcription factor [Thiomicrorhabdus sp. Milos-T2]
MTNSENIQNLKPLEEYAQFHKALAEPVRLRILGLLSIEESLCVCEFMDVLDLSQSTVSRHLAYLKNQGIVVSWREGTWMHYAVDKNHPAFDVLQTSLSFLSELEQSKEDRSGLKGFESITKQCHPKT